MKTSFFKINLFLLFLLPAQLLHADVVVLIHGYFSNAHSWQKASITKQLDESGWQHAGHLSFSYEGLFNEDFKHTKTDRLYYTANLPYKADASIQSDWLQGMLIEISKKNPQQPITLVGHSAGGVIARLALIRYGKGQVNRLITIAAPHLGTDKAIKALNATNNRGMFGFVKEWVVRDKIGNGVYNAVAQSRGILIDLLPPNPGTMLYWLNQQAHPDISYISIIRAQGYQSQDLVVPPISQDMNQIPAIAGKSQIILSNQGHELTPDDGILLLQIL